MEGLTAHERKKHFDMSMWGSKTDCGTVACAAGFCGLNPWFRRQGFKLTFVKRIHTFNEEFDGDYMGPPIKVPYFATEISNVEAFFGEGGDRIFYNTRKRPVEKVIREIQTHLKNLRAAP